jgi:alkenylglycerophosphocholine/alkenylglycerophosphoethanolamine hydrolase
VKESARGGLLLGLGLAGAGLYLLGVALRKRALRVVGKPVPALALAAWTLEPPRDDYARRVGTGLALSALGDVLLEDEARFQQGIAAFLAAHVAYTAAFAQDTRIVGARRGAAFAAYGVGSYGYLWRGLGKLKPHVGVYVAAITAMLWRASARVGNARGGHVSALTGLAGALSFAASDTLLAVDRFRTPIHGAEYPVIALYWLGQLGIAASVRTRA